MTGLEVLSFLAVSPLLFLVVVLFMAAAWCAVAAVYFPLLGICRGAAWLISKLG